jgi:23S rRNA pseudouridine2457 synthase
MEMSEKYFVIYKPFGILSQFSGEKDTLKTLFKFPEDVYPVGRLDKDSEGLLILTNDKYVNHYLLDPKFKHQRTYFSQVEGEPEDHALQQLENGVSINVDGKTYFTKRAKAERLKVIPDLPERTPPIRYRKNIPDTWIRLTLMEGKNRQVRKMTAAVGFPTLRLVRWGIEELTIEGYLSGEVREFRRNAIYEALKIKRP